MGNALTQLVETFYRACAGEPDLLDGVVTPEWEDIPLAPGQGPGPEGMKPRIKEMSRSMTNLAIIVHDLVDGRGGNGNGKIGVRGEILGVHAGEMFGIPATGREFRVPIHEFHDVVDGRLARTWHLEDWYGFFRQVGRAPQLGEGNR